MDSKKFDEKTFGTTCRSLAKKHPSIREIKNTYGFPAMYQRPFSFETLVQIILEQQVSLASGKAALTRLQTKLGPITPNGLLQLNTEQMRTCSVSRQKTGYLHHLSKTVEDGSLDLDELQHAPDDEVRKQLMQVKGIGSWTADIVLMLCLQRPDVFPLGDVALINSVRQIQNQPDWSVDEIESYTQCYKPHRTIAAFCYWHAYIKRKNIKTAV